MPNNFLILKYWDQCNVTSINIFKERIGIYLRVYWECNKNSTDENEKSFVISYRTSIVVLFSYFLKTTFAAQWPTFYKLRILKNYLKNLHYKLKYS